MNGVGGQQLAVGVARYKQNVMSFTALIRMDTEISCQRYWGSTTHDPSDETS